VLRVADCIRDGIRAVVPQATGGQDIGTQVKAAVIFAWAHLVNVAFVHHALLAQRDGEGLTPNILENLSTMDTI